MNQFVVDTTAGVMIGGVLVANAGKAAPLTNPLMGICP